MKRILLSAAVTLLFAIILNACKKTDVNTPAQQLPDLQTTIASSASGFITNENDEPVQGATVKLGSSMTTSDQDGYFEFASVQVVKNAAMISVNQPGYFKAFRTYMVEEGKAAFVRIKLLQKTMAGSIDAAAGGEVSLPDGLVITIPANAIVENATGTAYTGSVSVFAKWTDPASDEHIKTMPGSTMGLDKDGYMKVLNSYGVASAELTGAAGQALQIAPGKKATLKIPITSSSQSSAPATIALWHFNEETGLWAEEGQAVKSGNFYSADVSHFSFWNCSPPANPVGFYIRLLNNAGQPVPFAYVKLAEVNNPGNCGASFTGPDGIAFGIVPANTTFTITVSNGYGCASPVYTHEVQTGNGLTIGDISLPAAAIAIVSGMVLDCSMQPVTSGFVSMNYEGMLSRYNITQAGPFTFTTLLCGDGVGAHFIASDAVGLQESNPITFSIHSGANELGSLQACGINTMEYINYTINGNSVSTTSPQGFFAFAWNSIFNATVIQGFDTTTNNSMSIAFNFPGTAPGSSQLLRQLYFQPSQDSLSITSPVNVHITQYDAPGGFIAGNFSGTLTGRPPANLPYNISLDFKIRRAF